MDRSEHQFRPRAGDTIDLHEEYQVRQWTEIFNVSAVALHDAVHAVGSKRADVKRYLRAAEGTSVGSTADNNAVAARENT